MCILYLVQAHHSHSVFPPAYLQMFTASWRRFKFAVERAAMPEVINPKVKVLVNTSDGLAWSVMTRTSQHPSRTGACYACD